MKILHTADWHLGKKLYAFERLEEQKLVLQEIIDIAALEQVDMILVAGDLFDNINPSIEATDLLYSSLKKLTRDGRIPVIAIAGNHDSADRINMPNTLARECGIILVGYPHETYPLISHSNWAITASGPGHITIEYKDKPFPIQVTTTAFTNELRLKEYISEESEEEGLIQYLSQHWQNISHQYFDKKSFNILLGHLLIWPNQALTAPEEDDGEKSIQLGHTSIIPSACIPEQYHYVALGHLHRFQKIPGPTDIYYSGSPLCYSFAEAHQDKYVQIIDINDDLSFNCRKIQLQKGKKLLRQTCTTIQEAEAFIAENAEHHLEIELFVTESLSHEDYKRLRQHSQNLINIIPIVQSDNLDKEDNELYMNRLTDIRTSFQQFFIQEKGIPPHEELLRLFEEIISNED